MVEQVLFQLVDRVCPVCTATDTSHEYAPAKFDTHKLDAYAFASRKMPEYMHYRLIACPTCDVVYATPAPTVEQLGQAYHEAAFDSVEEAHFAARTYGHVLRRIVPYLPDRVGALDIGTGDGAFLEELLTVNFSKVMGVEPSAAPIAGAAPNVKSLIRHGLFDAADFVPNSLSLVTCFQTLEHLYDPQTMCDAAYTLLKPGGAVFFICHNRRALSARILGTHSPIFDIEHLQLFSPASARRLLENSGFSSIEVGPIYNRYPVHYWLKLLPLPVTLKQVLVPRLRKNSVGRLPVLLPAGNLAVIGYKR